MHCLRLYLRWTYTDSNGENTAHTFSECTRFELVDRGRNDLVPVSKILRGEMAKGPDSRADFIRTLNQYCTEQYWYSVEAWLI